MGPSEFDRLTQLVYAGVCDDRAFHHALGAIALSYRCASAAFVYSDPLLPAVDIEMTYGPFSDPAVRARYLTYAADDPAPQAMAGLGIGRAAATNRLFSPEVQARSRFVNEFYRPLGFVEALGGPVADGDGRIGIVAIHRGPDRDIFSDEEVSEFGRLLRHIANALAIRRQFFATLDQSARVAEALDHATNGVLILDRNGQLRHANMRAREILRRGDGMSLTPAGVLRFSDAEADRRLRALVGRCWGREPPAYFRIRHRSDDRPYVVRLTHLDGAQLDRDVEAWAAFIADPEAMHGDIGHTLEAALGLSRQAAALVASLMAGGDLAGFAAEAGISRNTVKSHLQGAFAATGVSRQTDLVRLATGVVHDLGVVPAR